MVDKSETDRFIDMSYEIVGLLEQGLVKEAVKKTDEFILLSQKLRNKSD